MKFDTRSLLIAAFATAALALACGGSPDSGLGGLLRSTPTASLGQNTTPNAAPNSTPTGDRVSFVK